MAIKNMFTMGKKDEGKNDDKPKCGPCPKCGEQMDNAGWGYCRCMNPNCENMGKKVKA
jgi:hypothetical protein